MSKFISTDDVVAGVRAVREAYAARFGFDPLAMASDLRERERSGGRTVIGPLAAAAEAVPAAGSREAAESPAVGA